MDFSVKKVYMDIFISGRVDYGSTPPSLRERSVFSVTLPLWLRPLIWAHARWWSSVIVDVRGVYCDLIHTYLDLTHLTGLDLLLITHVSPFSTSEKRTYHLWADTLFTYLNQGCRLETSQVQLITSLLRFRVVSTNHLIWSIKPPWIEWFNYSSIRIDLRL